MAWDVEMAKQFRQRDNSTPIGNIVGRIVSGFPDIKIAILDDSAVLTKDKIYCCNSLLSGYKREATITGNLKLNTSTGVAGGPAHSHSVNIDNDSLQTCTITYNDTLVVGDFVLLQHSADEKKWFIIEKITKL